MAIENGVLKPSGALQIRGGTWEALEAENPLLARRELCVEFDGDEIYLKAGNGEDNYLDLPCVGENFGNEFSLPDSDGNYYVMKDGEWIIDTNRIIFPESDNNVYVMKNEEWVQARLVTQPWEWSPAIDEDDDIVLTLDEDMNVYQLTGRNVSLT